MKYLRKKKLKRSREQTGGNSWGQDRRWEVESLGGATAVNKSEWDGGRVSVWAVRLRVSDRVLLCVLLSDWVSDKEIKRALVWGVSWNERWVG